MQCTQVHVQWNWISLGCTAFLGAWNEVGNLVTTFNCTCIQIWSRRYQIPCTKICTIMEIFICMQVLVFALNAKLSFVWWKITHRCIFAIAICLSWKENYQHLHLFHLWKKASVFLIFFGILPYTQLTMSIEQWWCLDSQKSSESMFLLQTIYLNHRLDKLSKSKYVLHHKFRIERHFYPFWPPLDLITV